MLIKGENTRIIAEEIMFGVILQRNVDGGWMLLVASRLANACD